MKSKILFWMFFIIFYLILFPFYSTLWELLFHTGTAIGNLAFIFFAIVALIPIAGVLSEIVTKFSLEKELNNNRRFSMFIAGLLIVVVSYTSFSIYDANRVKYFEALIPSYSGEVALFLNYDYVVTDEEIIEELLDILSEVKVKKMPDREWDPIVEYEDGMNLSIYVNDEHIFSAALFETRLSDYNEAKYYKVQGDPIDFSRFEEMIEQTSSN